MESHSRMLVPCKSGTHGHYENRHSHVGGLCTRRKELSFCGTKTTEAPWVPKQQKLRGIASQFPGSGNVVFTTYKNNVGSICWWRWVANRVQSSGDLKNLPLGSEEYIFLLARWCCELASGGVNLRPSTKACTAPALCSWNNCLLNASKTRKTLKAGQCFRSLRSPPREFALLMI